MHRDWAWFALLPLVVLPIGAASAFFLWGLEQAALAQQTAPWLLYLLPLAAWLMAWSYELWGRDLGSGLKRLLAEWREPQAKLPWRLAPLILFNTLGAHLFGASVGREGTALQLGGALADQWRGFAPSQGRLLLAMGMSAGFGAVFGTPLAGAVFALEVGERGRIFSRDLLPCLLAAFLADAFCQVLGGQHSHYQLGALPDWHWSRLGAILLSGLAFGLCARAFLRLVNWFRTQFMRLSPAAPWRAVAGSVLFVALVLALDARDYSGLGIPFIQRAFLQPLASHAFVLKLLLTAICIGAGLKGGEVTPLFFMGACLGNALAPWLDLPLGLMAGMGFVAVFSGAAKTPLACSLMGLELFGSEILPYALPCCVMAAMASGKQGLYGEEERSF